MGQGYLYWTAATNEPPGGKEDGAEIKRNVLERFQGWPDPIESLVQATDESNTFLSDTQDRDPVERWGEGRVTLLGDAAHPMTWDRGQGASQGIEGAVLLAKQLAQGRRSGGCAQGRGGRADSADEEDGAIVARDRQAPAV